MPVLPTTDLTTELLQQEMLEDSKLTDDEWVSRLLPELRNYIFHAPLGGIMISHPVIHDPFIRQTTLPERVNERYLRVQDEKEKCAHQRNWGRYIFLHERPYRFEALCAIFRLMTDEELWTHAGEVWTDSENIWQYADQWAVLFKCGRPKREFFMNEEERKVFASLPERIKVYRGACKLNKWGISWTLNREVAEGFAPRALDFSSAGKRRGKVGERTIKKSDVIAHKTERKEAEIVTLRFWNRR